MSKLNWINLKQGSKEWLQWRKRGIGSSDAPIIANKSPYGTPYDLWERKLGFADEVEENAQMRMGQSIEDIARAHYESTTGIKMTPRTGQRTDFPFLLASLDGFNNRENKDKLRIVLEIKHPGKKEHQEALKGKVPQKYQDQLYHQLIVTKADVVHYFSYDGSEGVKVDFFPDQERMRDLFEMEKEFWQLVVNQIPPPLSDRDFKKMKDVQYRVLFQRLGMAKGELDIAEKKYKELKKEVLGVMDHPRVICEGIKVIQTMRKGAIDYSMIPQLDDVDLEPFRKSSSPITQFRFPK